MTHTDVPMGTACILIDGAYGHRNLGDEAMLTAILQLLDSRRHDVWVFSADPEDTARRHGVNAIARASRYPRETWMARCARYPRKLARLGVLCRRMRFYVIGGGSLLSDERGCAGLFRYLCIATIARLTGADVLLLGVSIGPLRSRRARVITRMLVRLSRLIWVRDQESDDWIRRASAHPRVIRSWDVTFALGREALAIGGGERTGEVLGVSVRDIPPSRYYSEHDRKRAELVAVMAEALDEFVRATGVRILFLALQVTSAEDRRRVDDAAMSAEIVRRMQMKSYVSIRSLTTLEEAGESYAGCGLVLAERYHSVVFGLITGTPCLAIDYHAKVSRLVGELGICDSSVELESLLRGTSSSTVLSRALIKAWREREAVRGTWHAAGSKLEEQAKADAGEFGRRLRALVAASPQMPHGAAC